MTKLVKGFRDFYYLDAWKRIKIINDLNSIAKNSGFELLLLPQVEFMSSFIKSTGATSDIVQKQFFHCTSSASPQEKKIVLRPELTTGVIRYLEQMKKINTFQTHNIFSYGDCFRYENPQKGRYRQFLQWNIEKINFSPISFPHILSLLKSILTKLNLLNKVQIEINYLSQSSLEKTIQNLEKLKNKLPFCDVCQKRFLVKNIYRILDCKQCQKFILPLINLNDYLSLEQKQEYEKYYFLFKTFFPKTTIIQKSSLTRGLDYYEGLVFEIKFLTSDWSKNTFIAGGSYPLSAFSKTVNKEILGFGFAIGVDRLLLFLEELKSNYFLSLEQNLDSDIYIGVLEKNLFVSAYSLQQQMLVNNLKAIVLEKTHSFSDLLKKTIKTKAKWLLIFAQEFKNNNKIILRKINTDNKNIFQKNLTLEETIIFLKNKYHE